MFKTFQLNSLALTETWLKSDDNSDFITWDISWTGYRFAHTPRISGNDGGVVLLYRKNLKWNESIISLSNHLNLWDP